MLPPFSDKIHFIAFVFAFKEKTAAKKAFLTDNSQNYYNSYIFNKISICICNNGPSVIK